MSVQTYKPLYSAREAAEILLMNDNSVYELMNTGKLPYLILGKRKIRGTDLEHFIETYPIEKAGETA